MNVLNTCYVLVELYLYMSALIHKIVFPTVH